MNEKAKGGQRQGFSPWLKLLRVPNLLTVVGDPAAGYLLAHTGQGGGSINALLPAAGASLCFYCFGLILNDLVDVHVDREERPDRPLPSGQIVFNKARGAAVAFAFTGLNLALFAGLPVLYAAAVLATLIIFYNAGFKNLRFAGVVAMGLCRGFSFLMGAFAALETPRQLLAASGLPVMVGFLAVTLSIAGVSAVARREMDQEKAMGRQRYLPFVSLLATLPALVVVLASQQRLAQPGATVYIFLMIMTLMRSWFLGGVLYRLQPVPVTVGGHIRNHLMVQASLCAASGGWGLFAALVLILLSQVFAMLSRRFYSS